MNEARKPSILLVDDAIDFREEMRKSFGEDYNFWFAPNKEKALELVKQDFQWKLILLDLDLDGTGNLDNGLNLIKPLTSHLKTVPLIVVTNDSDPRTVVHAMKEGAVDFLYKGRFDIHEWKRTFDVHLNKPATKLAEDALQAVLSVSKESSHGFLGNAPAILEIKDELVALSTKPELTVLLTGETGVGKEVAARHLHQCGARSGKPFVPVHISSIPQTLLESSLFGHQAGAFTDAKTSLKGLFEQANGGVLFLDEIGEISQEFQVKLLRFLEDKIIRPLGSSKEIRLDVHIVAATNRNLKKEVEEGLFRRDLYQRISAYPIEIPPLRKRGEDISLLLEHYLLREKESMDVLTKEVKSKLLNYSYPGNVRELVGFVQRMCLKKTMKGMKWIDETILPDEILKPETQPRMEGAGNPGKKNDREIERVLDDLREIESALKRGKKQDAADLFGWNLDQLRNSIEKHHKKHPDIFDEFPLITDKYKLRRTTEK